jgi:hypothetical protein
MINTIYTEDLFFDMCLFSIYITAFNLYFDSYVCNKLINEKWKFNTFKYIFNLLISIVLNNTIFYFINFYVIIFFIFNVLLYIAVKNHKTIVLLKHLAYLLRKKLIILVK